MKKIRTLTIGSAIYLWHVHHRCVTEASGGQAHFEVFSVFLQGARKSPARILFPENDQQGHFTVYQEGVVGDHREPAWSLNLNQPGHARFMIELAKALGWAPGPGAPEFVLDNGHEVLRAHWERLDAHLARVSRRSAPG